MYSYKLHANMSVIDGNDIKDMFAGLTDATIQFVLRDLRAEFIAAIESVNTVCSSTELSPRPSLIMNAFRLCPIERARVVLLGQDPYIKAGQAQGLSFSVPEGFTIPPSLKNIYACMKHTEMLREMPKHGDLSSWAQQGVLMYNSALTTKLGKSNAHQAIWSKYTNALISHMSAKLDKIVFVLLGNDAKEKKSLIDGKKHIILEWGHPSPLSSLNQSDNPRNFKYCTAFKRINEILEQPIVWNTVCGDDVPLLKHAAPAPKNNSAERITDIDPKLAALQTHNVVSGDPYHIYIFTDGGASGNGKAKCVATWGVCYISAAKSYSLGGKCENVAIAGVEYTTSNNRGELTAIAKALEIAQDELDGARDSAAAKITIVSDSEYSINCITKWAYTWEKKPEELKKKKNTDLIMPAHTVYKDIRDKITIIHVRSHRTEPADKKSREWFLWKGNSAVDDVCTEAK